METAELLYWRSVGDWGFILVIIGVMLIAGLASKMVIERQMASLREKFIELSLQPDLTNSQAFLDAQSEYDTLFLKSRKLALEQIVLEGKQREEWGKLVSKDWDKNWTKSRILMYQMRPDFSPLE